MTPERIAELRAMVNYHHRHPTIVEMTECLDAIEALQQEVCDWKEDCQIIKGVSAHCEAVEKKMIVISAERDRYRAALDDEFLSHGRKALLSADNALLVAEVRELKQLLSDANGEVKVYCDDYNATKAKLGEACGLLRMIGIYGDGEPIEEVTAFLAKVKP